MSVVQWQDGLGDAARVEGVGLPDPAVGARVHLRGLDHEVAGIVRRAGQAGAVGPDAFNDPEGVEICSCAASYPGNGTLKPGCGSWELCPVEDLSGGAGQDREGVGSGVSVHADDEWAGVRDDRHWWSTFLPRSGI